MFTHHCTACDRTQLMSLSQVAWVDGAADGTGASFVCWCGAPQTTDVPPLDTARIAA